VSQVLHQHELTTCIAASIGQLLANAAEAAGDRGATDAAEITAITEAMMRLLAGVPLRSDGKLTIKSLAAEADLRRNKLTHKHTGLKDLFNALVQAQNTRPAVADDLHRDNEALREKLAKITQERDDLKASNEQFARVVHVLEVENLRLRTDAPDQGVVQLLRPQTT
jgi:ribonuclease HI